MQEAYRRCLLADESPLYTYSGHKDSFFEVGKPLRQYSKEKRQEMLNLYVSKETTGGEDFC